MNSRIWAICFLWLQAYLFWAGSGALLVPLAAVALAIAGLLLRRPLPISDRRWLAATSGCALFTFCLALGRSPLVDDAGSVLSVPMTFALANALLMAQAMLLLPMPDRRWPMVAACLGIVTCLCALNHTIEPQERSAYLVLAIAAAVFAGLSFQSPAHEASGKGRWKQYRTLLVVIALTACCTWIVADMWQMSVTRVQAALPGWVATAVGHNQGGRSYVRTGSLSSISMERRTDPQHVALRVYADFTPGYLRGRAFHSYRRSQWHGVEMGQFMGKNNFRKATILEPLPSPPAELPTPAAEQNTFQLADHPTASLRKMEIHNAPDRGPMLFTKLGTAYMQGQGTYLAIDQQQIAHVGIDSEVPYFVFASRSAAEETLAEEQRSLLLRIPYGIDPQVRQLSNEVCQNARSPQTKMDAIAKFFKTEFEYAHDGMEVPRNVEPLSYFLLQRPAAHCEFFASGAATLLRLQGVPCRYVTGYVATELEGEYGDYWLARNRNAHAWVEAYDDERRRWVIVEATPGMVVPEDDLPADAAANVTGATGQQNASNGLSRLRRNWIGRFISRMLDWGKFVIAPIGLAVAIWFARWAMQRRASATQFSMDPRIAQLQRERIRVDRKLRRRKLIRQPHETLHQFAVRLQQTTSDDAWIAQVAQWYLTYAELRYGKAKGNVMPLG